MPIARQAGQGDGREGGVVEADDFHAALHVLQQVEEQVVARRPRSGRARGGRGGGEDGLEVAAAGHEVVESGGQQRPRGVDGFRRWPGVAQLDEGDFPRDPFAGGVWLAFDLAQVSSGGDEKPLVVVEGDGAVDESRSKPGVSS